MLCLVRWSWPETINDFLFHLGSYGIDTSPTWISVLSKLSRDLQADTKRASVPAMVCRAGQRSWERKWDEVTLAGSHLLPTRAPKSEIVQEILSDRWLIVSWHLKGWYGPPADGFEPKVHLDGHSPASLSDPWRTSTLEAKNDPALDKQAQQERPENLKFKNSLTHQFMWNLSEGLKISHIL